MKKVLHLLNRFWHWTTLSVLLAITSLSLMPLPSLPDVPGSDKTHHLIAYAALMLPAFFANHKTKGVLMALFALWSGVIELVQPYVNRYGEWLDFGANTLGLIIGAILGVILKKVYTDFLD